MTNRDLIKGLCTVGISMLALFLSLTVHSQIQRGTAVVIALGGLCFAWAILRKHAQSWLGLALLGSGLLTLGVGILWSGLNVIRFYLYDPAIVGSANYTQAYEVVTKTQVVLQWCGGGLLLLLILELMALPFRRRFSSLHEDDARRS